MRYNFRARKDESTGEYVIDMKCLECGYEEEIPLDIFSGLFDPEIGENPALTARDVITIYLFRRMLTTK